MSEHERTRGARRWEQITKDLIRHDNGIRFHPDLMGNQSYIQCGFSTGVQKGHKLVIKALQRQASHSPVSTSVEPGRTPS